MTWICPASETKHKKCFFPSAAGWINFLLSQPKLLFFFLLIWSVIQTCHKMIRLWLEHWASKACKAAPTGAGQSPGKFRNSGYFKLKNRFWKVLKHWHNLIKNFGKNHKMRRLGNVDKTFRLGQFSRFWLVRGGAGEGVQINPLNFADEGLFLRLCLIV